jgi:hypothetical protein
VHYYFEAISVCKQGSDGENYDAEDGKLIYFECDLERVPVLVKIFNDVSCAEQEYSGFK